MFSSKNPRRLVNPFDKMSVYRERGSGLIPDRTSIQHSNDLTFALSRMTLKAIGGDFCIYSCLCFM